MHLFAVTVVILYLYPSCVPQAHDRHRRVDKSQGKVRESNSHRAASPPMHSVHQWSREAEVLSVPRTWKSRAASSHKSSASQSQLSIPIALEDMRNWEYAPRKNSAFSSLLHSRAMMSNLITQAKTQHQSTVDLHSCTSIGALVCLYGFCLHIPLCPFDANSQLVTAHFLDSPHLWCFLNGFLLPSRFRERRPFDNGFAFPLLWEKASRGYRNDTLRQCFWWSWPLLWLFRILSLLVLFRNHFTIGTNVALSGAEISWTHRTRHLLQTGIQELFCRSANSRHSWDSVSFFRDPLTPYSHLIPMCRTCCVHFFLLPGPWYLERLPTTSPTETLRRTRTWCSSTSAVTGSTSSRHKLPSSSLGVTARVKSVISFI